MPTLLVQYPVAPVPVIVPEQVRLPVALSIVQPVAPDPPAISTSIVPSA